MTTQTNTYRDVTDRAERDKLILDHLSLVRHVLGRVIADLPPDIDRDNLEAAGALGLVEASQNFDAKRGVAFPAFAYARIRGAILDELRRNCPLPQHVLQLWTRIREVMARMLPPVTSEAIAEALALPVEDVDSCLSAVRMSRMERWENCEQISEPLHDDTTESTHLQCAERQQALAAAIEQLPDAMRVAITLYYLEEMRMKEIGEVLSVSESRVSRLLAEAKSRLKISLRHYAQVSESMQSVHIFP